MTHSPTPDFVREAVEYQRTKAKASGSSSPSAPSTSVPTGGVVEPIAFSTPEQLLPFPTWALPEAIGRFVRSVSDSLEVPVDLAAMLGLGVMAGALMGAWKGAPRPDWIEPLNLYIAVAMEPGEQKSATHKAMLAPQRIYDKSLRTSWKQRAAMIEAQNAELDKADRVAVPVMPRLFADDVTAEKLANMLASQGEQINIASDEGTVFDQICGIYSSTPNNSIYLKGHGGDTYMIDRQVEAKNVILESPLININVAIQPEVVRGLKGSGNLRGRGMWARFLFSCPATRIGTKTFDTVPVDPEVRMAYHEFIFRLIRTVPTTWHGYDAFDPEQRTQSREPGIVRFSEEAWADLREVLIRTDRQMLPGRPLYAIADWASKLRGAIVRIACGFHIAECAGAGIDPASHLLSSETVRRAIAVGRYLLSHAQHAFGEMAASPVETMARQLLAWAKVNKKTSFTRRDAQRIRTFREGKALDEALALLEEWGQVELKTVKKTTTVILLAVEEEKENQDADPPATVATVEEYN